MKYVLFLAQSTFCDATYSELYNDKNVLIYKKINNKVLNSIRNIHTSIKLNHYFRIPLQGVWKHTFFDETTIKNDEEAIFLFEEGNKQAYDRKYLHYLKKRYRKAKLFFMFYNPAAYISKKEVDFVIKNYAEIISFNPYDCEKYGWLHYSGIYSKPNENICKKEPKYDVFFVGNDKGRLKIIREIYKKLQEGGLKCEFYVSDVGRNECINDGIHYNQYMHYNEVIEHVKKSKAVLEVLQDFQNGSTMRTMESLVYEKLLITNNLSVKDERYYNENKFYIFEDFNSLNSNDILKMLSLSSAMKYDGCLSPYRFLEFLKQIYRNTK